MFDSSPDVRVGVLALQGDFAEHIQVLRSVGVSPIEVKLPEELLEIQGLIIPGGESTVIGRLLHEWGLWQVICERVKQKKLGIWGTCAGAILLAKNTPNLEEVVSLQLLDMTIQRNAFGRQTDSFAAQIRTSLFENPMFSGIFIRAPVITGVGKAAQAIAWLEDGTVVAAEQEGLLATAFHPELTQDPRFHLYFLNMLKNKIKLETQNENKNESKKL